MRFDRNANNPEKYAPLVEGVWKCPECTGINPEVNYVCRDCGQRVRHAEEPDATPSVGRTARRPSFFRNLRLAFSPSDNGNEARRQAMLCIVHCVAFLLVFCSAMALLVNLSHQGTEYGYLSLACIVLYLMMLAALVNASGTVLLQRRKPSSAVKFLAFAVILYLIASATCVVREGWRDDFYPVLLIAALLTGLQIGAVRYAIVVLPTGGFSYRAWVIGVVLGGGLFGLFNYAIERVESVLVSVLYGFALSAIWILSCNKRGEEHWKRASILGLLFIATPFLYTLATGRLMFGIYPTLIRPARPGHPASFSEGIATILAIYLVIALLLLSGNLLSFIATRLRLVRHDGCGALRSSGR